MRLHVSFDIEVPKESTREEAAEWIRFALHEENQIAGSHPLVNYELEAENVIVDLAW